MISTILPTGDIISRFTALCDELGCILTGEFALLVFRGTDETPTPEARIRLIEPGYSVYAPASGYVRCPPVDILEGR